MLRERHIPNATLCNTNVVNPNAIPYIPHCFPKGEVCYITHILIIFSFLIIYLLIFDDMNVNIKNKLKEIKLTNQEKIIIGHLNINSIRYKTNREQYRYPPCI